LIVIGLLVLTVALAIPAFNAIARSSSIDSATNQINAYFADARAQAVGLQQTRGVIMFRDAASGRVTLAQVHYPEDRSFPTLDLFGGRDEMVLPQNVAVRALPSNSTTALTSQYENWPEYCIVLFDGNGKVLFEQLQVPTNSNLYRRLTQVVTNPPATTIPPAGTTFSHMGFILYEQSEFEDAPAGTQRDWLKDNGVPFIVNRYNGSLLKGE
jgi:hypothetical protein